MTGTVVLGRRTAARASGRAAAGLRAMCQAVEMFVRGAAGADAYGAYVLHHHREHPDVDPLDEAEFWRARYAATQRQPEARCC